MKAVEDAKLARTIPYTRIDEDTAIAFNFTEEKMAISAHQKSSSDQHDDTEAGGDLLADVPSDEESDEYEMTMCNVCGKLRDPYPDTTTKSHELYRDPRFLDRESCQLENWEDPSYMYKGEFCSHKHQCHLRGNVPVMPLFSGPKIDTTLHREKKLHLTTQLFGTCHTIMPTCLLTYRAKRGRKALTQTHHNGNRMQETLCFMNGTDCVVGKH